MKRRALHQNNHPFDSRYPFEAFWSGSWRPVERLNISNGAVTAHIVGHNGGEVIHEDMPISHLRVRSRKATCPDCLSCLRPGIDICVLSTIKNSENGDDAKIAEPVWIDARIRSIERKPHDFACACQFYVSFYINQGPDLVSENKKLSKETSVVKIDQVFVLQKLQAKPCDAQFFRWSSSEDCYAVQKFNGKFCADLSWLLVSSVLKRAAFDIRAIKNCIVYEISENDHVRVQAYPHDRSYTVNFKLENDVLTPVVLQFALDTLPEESDCYEIESSSFYDLMGLRRSKRRAVPPDRYSGCDNIQDYEIVVTRLYENKTYKVEYDDEIKLEYDEYDEIELEYDECDEITVVPSVQVDNEYEKRGKSCCVKSSTSKPQSRKRSAVSKSSRKQSGAIDKGDQETLFASVPKDELEDIDDLVFKFSDMNGSPSSHKMGTFDFNKTEMENRSIGAKKGLPRRHNEECSYFTSLEGDCFNARRGMCDVRNLRKGSASAHLCRELIKRCMNNIDNTLKNETEQLPLVDQWEKIRLKQYVKPLMNNEEDVSEIDLLWKEMELALASWYLLDDTEDSNAQPTSQVEKSIKDGENVCEHDYRLDEQVGTVCQLCGFVETEIKDILPPFASSSKWTSSKDQRAENNSHHKDAADFDQCSIPAASNTPSTEGEVENDVWALIPDLRSKLRSHQKEAFEFLWRNIAGSFVPSQMEKRENRRGGCVISHSPGAGKTLLIIAFLVSYLKLFPASRPLVLAPKTTLYTWYKEMIKWEVAIPVYQIHGGQTYKSEVSKQRIKLSPGVPRNQDVMHVLDCLEKMQNWLSHPSILLMGYTSFFTLTREDSNHEHRRYMAQLLKHYPGILILDEGHNPRSTKSRLRKGLMKVNTRLRILLSGTLFQNNFGEYFNTLCLARPSFVGEVLEELDPKYNREGQTQFRLENRGRKLFIDKISKNINSSKGEDRVQALKTLKKLTSKFIDVYEGGGSDELPGLECYTLMMKSTSLQQEILSKLQNPRPIHNQKGFPLELELLITLGSIHPCLIRTTTCSIRYFTSKELMELEQSKLDIKSGSKVQFVMNLVPRCLIQNEKVLIFCHNIAPINLFVQLFDKFYGWRKGREVLVLKGDMELFERGRVMDKFEEPHGVSKVMLASISACAEGISLTAASRVILLDSEWNPSKTKQAIARAFRPGQNRVVYVYQLLATGTLEEDKHSRTTWKEWVSDMIFSDEHVDQDPSHWQAPRIEDELLREIVEEDRAALFHRIMKNEKASNVIGGKGMLKRM